MASSHPDGSAVLAFCPGIVAEDFSIHPLWSISRHVLLTQRFAGAPAMPGSAHNPLQHVPNPPLQMLLVPVIPGRAHIPFHLTASSRPTCVRQPLIPAGEPPALPAKGELIGTAPSPARAHAQPRHPRFEGSPPESPANYIASR